RGDVPYRLGASGCPLIDGALAHLECEPHAQVDAGDHTVFLGLATNGIMGRSDGEPLLYFRGAYRFLGDA
ncbi:MAG: flavin reductase family protein, partial [Candidatus Binatia bacterium]